MNETNDQNKDNALTPAELQEKSLSWWLQQLSPSQLWKVFTVLLGLLIAAFSFGVWAGGLDLPYVRDVPWFGKSGSAGTIASGTSNGQVLAPLVKKVDKLLSDSKANITLAEVRASVSAYHHVIREAQALLPQDPFISALEPITDADPDPRSVVIRISQLAEHLRTLKVPCI